jgi:hypothetical protein
MLINRAWSACKMLVDPVFTRLDGFGFESLQNLQADAALARGQSLVPHVADRRVDSASLMHKRSRSVGRRERPAELLRESRNHPFIRMRKAGAANPALPWIDLSAWFSGKTTIAAGIRNYSARPRRRQSGTDGLAIGHVKAVHVQSHRGQKRMNTIPVLSNVPKCLL